MTGPPGRLQVEQVQLDRRPAASSTAIRSATPGGAAASGPGVGEGPVEEQPVGPVPGPGRDAVEGPRRAVRPDRRQLRRDSPAHHARPPAGARRAGGRDRPMRGRRQRGPGSRPARRRPARRGRRGGRLAARSAARLARPARRLRRRRRTARSRPSPAPEGDVPRGDRPGRPGLASRCEAARLGRRPSTRRRRARRRPARGGARAAGRTSSPRLQGARHALEPGPPRAGVGRLREQRDHRAGAGDVPAGDGGSRARRCTGAVIGPGAGARADRRQRRVLRAVGGRAAASVPPARPVGDLLQAGPGGGRRRRPIPRARRAAVRRRGGPDPAARRRRARRPGRELGGEPFHASGATVKVGERVATSGLPSSSRPRADRRRRTLGAGGTSRAVVHNGRRCPHRPDPPAGRAGRRIRA